MRKSWRGHLCQRQRALRPSADQTSGAADARPRQRARAAALRAATNARRSRGPLTRVPVRATTSMTRIKFGTDGWRAVIAEDFTFANVDRVAQATADHWNANPVAGTEKEVVVGFDRRFLSDQFARRAAEVFCGNGFQVVLTAQPTPPPAVSFAVKARRAISGGMITPNHNPAAFHGFKLQAHYGGSAAPAPPPALPRSPRP